MPDAAPATKLQIAMNFLADGRVGVELMEGWYLSHDLQVAAVDDLAATSEILRGWASHPHEKPRPRYEAYVQFPEHREAYLVILSAQPDESLRRFTETPDALCRSFNLAFGSGDPVERAAAAAGSPTTSRVRCGTSWHAPGAKPRRDSPAVRTWRSSKRISPPCAQ